MHSMLHVESEADFTKYLISIGDPCAAYTVKGQTCPDSVLVAQGEKIYSKKACQGCHTNTGAKLVGPTWKGIWGRAESTDHGPITVDEAYVRESVLQPQAKIVTGYPPTMPSFAGQISDQEIDEVIAYMKSLK
jgi:cytochrome c oxidase subunit 2